MKNFARFFTTVFSGFARQPIKLKFDYWEANWANDHLLIRNQCSMVGRYLALTYDHRLIDGREAVTFLRNIKAAIEDPRRLLLDL